MAFLDFSNGFAPVQRVSKGVSKKIKLLNLIGIFMVRCAAERVGGKGRAADSCRK